MNDVRAPEARLVLAVALVATVCASGCGAREPAQRADTARPTPMSAPAEDPIDRTLGREDLDRIRGFILRRGDRQTYGNRFNDNPHYRFGVIDAYLDPEDGSNIGCDPRVSGFDELVLRRPDADARWLVIRLDAATGALLVEPPHHRALAEDALRQVLAEIRDVESASGHPAPE